MRSITELEAARARLARKLNRLGWVAVGVAAIILLILALDFLK